MGKTIFICVYIGKNLLQNQLANSNQTWYKAPLGKGNLKLYKSGPLQRGDKHKNAKIEWGNFKIFFSRTTKPEKLRFTQKLPNIVEIQICTNHGPRGSGGTHLEKSFLHVFILGKKSLKIFFRTNRPISIKLNINHPTYVA
jgi:hypothetical protein